MIPDILRFCLRIRVVPSCVTVICPVDVQAVIMRSTLPGADTRCIARSEERIVDGVRREIVITLDDNRVVAAGDQLAIPTCFNHYLVSFLRRCLPDALAGD